MIFRTIFWFSLVVMLVPIKNDRMNPQSTDTTNVEALVLLQSVADDVAGFCLRNPSACLAAGELATNYGSRLQSHFTNLSQYLLEDEKSPSQSKLTTGSISKQ